jgi:hypothetical protein
MTTVIVLAIGIVGFEFLRRAKGSQSKLVVALIFLVVIGLVVASRS